MRFLTALLFLLATTLAGAEVRIVSATGFTYQGHLQDESGPVNDTVDMTFTLFDGYVGGSQVGAPLSYTDVNVDDGLFQVGLDFGNQAYASGLWLAIEVDGQSLAPRQAIRGAPFAISAAYGGSNWERSGANIHRSSGRVGIGTSSPSVPLDVWGSAKFGAGGNEASGGLSFVGGGSFNTASGSNSFVGGGSANTAEGVHGFVGGGFANTAGGDRSFAAGYRAKAEHAGTFVWGDRTVADFASTGEDQFLIRAGGGVGIGTNAPERDLHIKADSSSASLILENASDVDGWGIGTGTGSGNFNFYYESDVDGFTTVGTRLGGISNTTGEYSSNSDRRLKQDIEALNGVLADVLKLEPASYRFRRSGDDSPRTIGFLAQDVQKVFPELVTNEDGDGYLGLSYANFSVLAIRAVQEQQAIIESQKDRMSEGEQRLGRLEAENTELRQLAESNKALQDELIELRETLDSEREMTSDRLAALEALLLEDRQVAEQSQ